MYVLAPVTIEQIFTFIKKMNKTFCRNDAFDIKTFDSEQLEKLAEYCCDLVKWSFKSGISQNLKHQDHFLFFSIGLTKAIFSHSGKIPDLK